MFLSQTGGTQAQHLPLIKDEPLARFIREQAAGVWQATDTSVRLGRGRATSGLKAGSHELFSRLEARFLLHTLLLVAQMWRVVLLERHVMEATERLRFLLLCRRVRD